MCLAIAGAGCAAPGPAPLAVYASLPLHGPSASRAQDLLQGFQAGLAASDYLACSGRYAFRLVTLDNTTDGVWDATLEAAAANKAGTDSTAIAYLGSFEPGPVLVSLPILNQAGPMLLLAPMNTYPAFTFPSRRSGDPNEYYPSGVRNLARLGPTDFQIGSVAARWAQQAGATTVFILYDLYDPTLQGLNVARGFESAAAVLGLKVMGSFGVDRFAPEFDSVMDQIGKQSGGGWPSLLFYAGPPADHLKLLFAAKQAWLGDAEQVPVLSAPGFAAQAFADAAGPAAQGTYVVTPALPIAQWPSLGREFADGYARSTGAQPGIDALYGYGAAVRLVQAVEAVCKDGGLPARRAVMQQALARPVVPVRLPRNDVSDSLLPPADRLGVYRITVEALDFLETIRAGE